VQFALERGVPAMIGIIATDRIPYPARSFDMAHCSRCLIPWNKYGKLNIFRRIAISSSFLRCLIEITNN
jgi:Putative S-adenosyl-L-methionine-dependent methyltransferase